VTARMDARLLLCWGYHREGWIRPIEGLRDRFEVHYLFYRSRAEEEAEGAKTDAPRLYWGDFKTAVQILDRVRPNAIVFMALDGAWSIALNAAARRRGIPTFVLQHGHFDKYRSATTQANSHSSRTSYGSNPWPAIRFTASTYGLRGIPGFLGTMRFMLAVRRSGPSQAMTRYRFHDRFPDRYIALSPESAQVHVRQDGASESVIDCIGIPEYDSIFQNVEARAPSDGSVLLIDSPNARNRWGEVSASVDEKAEFLLTLDAIAAQLQLPLRIKLHPETFHDSWLPRLQVGEYLQDASVVQELSSAAVCVGFDSTLLIPAVWLRPTVLIQLRPSAVCELARTTGAAVVLDALEDIDVQSLQLSRRHFRENASGRADFIRRVAVNPSGKAQEALVRILTEHTESRAIADRVGR
jgi:hypothetical protein